MNRNNRQSIVSRVLEMLPADTDPAILENPQAVIDALGGGMEFTMRSFDLRIIYDHFMTCTEPIQGDILASLTQLRGAEDREELASRCMEYRSLLSLLSIDSVVSLMRRMSIEELAVKNPGNLRSLDIVHSHPLVGSLDGQARRRAVRLVASMIVMAARADCYGNGEVSFLEEMQKRYGRIRQKESTRPSLRRSRRGGVQKRRHKLGSLVIHHAI